MLKAYAKKRRDEAGAPVELHPATRRLLQGEVKRTLGQASAPAEEKAKIVFSLWTRWAFGTAICIFLAGGLFLIESRRTPSEPAQMAQATKSELESLTAPSAEAFAEKSAARENASPIGGASPAPAEESPKETRAVRADATNSRQESNERRFNASSVAKSAGEKRTADEFRLKHPVPAPVVQALPEPKNEINYSLSDKERSLSAADGLRPEEKAQTSDLDDPRKKVEAEPPKLLAQEAAAVVSGKAGFKREVQAAKPAALTGALNKAVAEGKIQKEAELDGAVPLYFTQQDMGRKYRQNLQSPPQPELLKSFQVARAGSRLQILDADGSVYEGDVVSFSQSRDVSGKDIASNKKQKADSSLDHGKAAARAPASVPPGQTTTPENFSFRVSGTNRQNQVVVLTGNFIASQTSPPLPSGPADVQTGERSRAVSSGRLQVLQSPTGATIQATAVVSRTNEFQINAVQTSR